MKTPHDEVTDASCNPLTHPAAAGKSAVAGRVRGFLPSCSPHRSRRFVVCSLAMDWKNRLYFGDNLDILRREVPDASVDLIYLDPPFNSNATYNVLFKEKSGEESAAQITAFEDTWQWSVEAEAVYKEIVTSGPRGLAGGHGTSQRRFRGELEVLARQGTGT